MGLKMILTIFYGLGSENRISYRYGPVLEPRQTTRPINHLLLLFRFLISSDSPLAENEFCFSGNTSGEIEFVGGIRCVILSRGLGYRVRVCSLPPLSLKAESCLKRDVNRQRSSLESMFRYDKPIPEEIIEVPVGLSMSEREIGDNQRCTCCEAKGALLCATCSGSGLYVDSIMESQGIIVKVRCLDCGGTGNIMCKSCGGRGYVGH